MDVKGEVKFLYKLKKKYFFWGGRRVGGRPIRGWGKLVMWGMGDVNQG